MLSVEALEVRYGGYLAIEDVSLHVAAGEIVCLMGANGSGKSSLMNAVSGLVTPAGGRVTFDGADMAQVPTYQRLARGLAHVLERRRLFPYMTVLENLLLGAYVPALRPARAEMLESVLAMFPALRDRKSQLAHTLSGGEQQMVAIARGLMARPRLLMIDEPFLGLARHLAALRRDRIDLVDDDCGFESHGQVKIAESAAELAMLTARVAELRALGFGHEVLIDRQELREVVPAATL